MVDFSEALVSFEIAARARGSVSERTITQFRNDLLQFHRAFPFAVDSVTRDHCRLFLGGDGRWTAATKLIRWKSLDAFFSFCVDEDFLDRSPMVGVDRPRGAKKARKPDKLTEQDMDTLLLMWPEWTWMGLRNRAILMAFWTMPFRLSELAGIQMKQVDLANYRIASERRKGNDEGYSATIFPKAAHAIDRYRRKLPKEWKTKPYLWIDQDGDQLSPHAVQQVLRRSEQRAKAAGFPKHIYAHGFRHNFGMKTVQWGMSMDLAAKRMGHASDDVVGIYRQWVAEEESEIQMRIIAGVPQ